MLMVMVLDLRHHHLRRLATRVIFRHLRKVVFFLTIFLAIDLKELYGVTLGEELLRISTCLRHNSACLSSLCCRFFRLRWYSKGSSEDALKSEGEPGSESRSETAASKRGPGLVYDRDVIRIFITTAAATTTATTCCSAAGCPAAAFLLATLLLATLLLGLSHGLCQSSMC